MPGPAIILVKKIDTEVTATATVVALSDQLLLTIVGRGPGPLRLYNPWGKGGPGRIIPTYLHRKTSPHHPTAPRLRRPAGGKSNPA